MAHFAQLDENNVVLQVIVVGNDMVDDLPYPESESVGVAYCQSLFGTDTRWKQTSFNHNFRHWYAGIGYTYDDNLDAFIEPQPFPSWSLDTLACVWVPPVPYPEDGLYYWDEGTLTWVKA